MNYGGTKYLLSLATMGFDEAMDTPIAAKFMLNGLMGSGTKLSFEHGSDVSVDKELENQVQGKGDNTK